MKDINLLPDRIYIETYNRKKNLKIVLYILAFVMLLSGLYLYELRIEHIYKVKINDMNVYINSTRNTAIKRKELYDLKKQLSDYKLFISNIKNKRIDWPKILDDLTLVTNNNVSLISVTADDKGIAIKAEAKSNGDISRFVKNLKSLSYLSDVRLNSVNDNGGNLLYFDVNATCKGIIK